MAAHDWMPPFSTRKACIGFHVSRSSLIHSASLPSATFMNSTSMKFVCAGATDVCGAGAGACPCVNAGVIRAPAQNETSADAINCRREIFINVLTEGRGPPRPEPVQLMPPDEPPSGEGSVQKSSSGPVLYAPGGADGCSVLNTRG